MTDHNRGRHRLAQPGAEWEAIGHYILIAVTLACVAGLVVVAFHYPTGG